MAFLRFRAEADPDLQQHLKSCPRNANTLVIVFKMNS